MGVGLAAGGALPAQTRPASQSDSAPMERFITVQPNVKLEVLDWGGTGRPMVLLAGQGNTAQVFDHLARQLRANHHVYGITRRGFGESSAPDSGYSADRLGDDVLAVIDSLHLEKPVLAGHSIAGEEMSSIGSRHGDRVSALVYMDAAYGYAFYDTTNGNFELDINELRKKLDTLSARLVNPRISELLDPILPRFERDLRDLLESPDSDAPLPAVRLPTGVNKAILEGERKYTHVSAPVLAIIAHPPIFDTFATPAEKLAAEAWASAHRARQVDVVRHAASIVRIVDVPNAPHYVFLSNEAEVVRAINEFLDSLPVSKR
jgi:pimeloyl-ACP methyl ester carboxylesterase